MENCRRVLYDNGAWLLLPLLDATANPRDSRSLDRASGARDFVAEREVDASMDGNQLMDSIYE